MMTWLLRFWQWLERLKEAIDKAKAKLGTVMTDFWRTKGKNFKRKR